MTKRFIYNRTSQMITDDLTGFTYHRNKKVCDLLNQESDRADRNAELYCPFKLLMRKYGIESIEKLDRILFEQKVW